MSTSPDRRGTGVLRGPESPVVTAARFDLDFRGALVPDELVAEARATARAQGYAAGWAEGKRQATAAAQTSLDHAAVTAATATADLATRLDRTLTAVAGAARSLEQRAAQTSAEAAELILSAGLALAEALVGHELAVSRTPGEDAVRRALALAPIGRPVLVRLHPADHAVLAAAGAQREVDGRTVTLLADPVVGPGDAVAECDATTIDARLGAALDRVRDLLTDSAAAAGRSTVAVLPAAGGPLAAAAHTAATTLPGAGGLPGEPA
jgi:flagellar assembly protein FliH